MVDCGERISCEEGSYEGQPFIIENMNDENKR